MILTGILSMVAAAGLLAQQPPAAKKDAPKGPAPKSQAELTKVQALFNAQSAGPDAVIKAAEDLIDSYKDTDFKEIALYVEAVAYQQKRDPVKAQIFAERVLEINPKNVQATLMIGELIAQSVRENDLDKEDKLAKAEKMLNDTITNAKAMEKPNPQITDAQWEEQRKYLIAEATNDLGLCALARKKYDDAINDFKSAYDGDPQPAYQVRLASAYQNAGKNDEAIALCDKLLADPQLHPQIKSVATQIKASATAAKGGK
ncbi:MAG TPA: tetratricopeptide repeat protein [Candidatus Sulfopaludibacter sp.]|nr:tetratricopeptide repeat protein [Candidatus Sulfopaludibacter sp.]